MFGVCGWGFFCDFCVGWYFFFFFFAFHNSLFLYFCAHVQGSCFCVCTFFVFMCLGVHVVSVKFTHPRLFLGISSHTWAISKPDAPVEENHRPRTTCTYREKADDRHGILLSSSGSFFRLARWMDGSSAY